MPFDYYETEIARIDESSLSLAKKYILSGVPVAFPTETVYGLGANAFDDEGVKRIFAAKGRPSDNPLIVHVYDGYPIEDIAEIKYSYAKKLAKTFQPGPLTMVYPSKGKVCKTATCGLDTVGIRVPSDENAQKFLKFVGVPVAAPSANASKHTSPVTAMHVYDDLKGKIPLILDGGKCTGGIESTVLSVTTKTPTILRSGLVTAEMIKNTVGNCAYSDNKITDKVRAPGMKYTHYVPRCDTALFRREQTEMAQKLYDDAISSGKRVAFMCDEEISERVKGNKLLLGRTAKEIASNLYYRLIEAEKSVDLLIAFDVDTHDEIDIGIMNRLTKACKRY